MNLHSCVRALASGLLMAVVLVACGDDGSSKADRTVVHGQSSGRLPDETLVDWVSYADGVAVVTVLSEQEIPLQPGDVNVAGEGMQGRTLSLRVDRMVWTRAQARQVPQEFPMKAPGWVLKAFQKQPFTTGSVRLETDSTYLMALVWVFDGGWSQLGSETAVLLGSDGRPVADGRVANPTVRGFIGKSVEEIRATLAGTAPDPIAAKYFDLDSIRRYGAVQRELGQPVTE